MNKKIFSVVTSCLNSQNTIERTIKSVLAQKQYVKEYVIIDGLSKDSTLNIINKYKNQFFLNKICLTIVSEKDNGIYDAMNKGINKCTGKIISIINSDDWYETNIFSLVFNFFIKNPNIDILHGDLNYHYNNKVKIHYPKHSSNFFWLGMTLNHPTFFVKKKVYDQIKYDPSYQIAGDYVFLLKTISMKIQYGYINKILVNFSSGGASEAFFTRIKEGHRARIENGFSFFKTWLCTIFTIFIVSASSLKKIFFKFKTNNF